MDSEKKTKKPKAPKWFKGMIYTKGETVNNPFSGESYELTGLELSIYDFIIGSQMVIERIGWMNPKTAKAQREMSKAISWFRVNNPEAYYVLLDQQQFSFHEINTDNRIQSEAVGKQRLQARTHKVRAFRGKSEYSVMH